MTALEKVGSVVRDIRMEKGMTQKEFADLIGINVTIVSHIENGCPNHFGPRTERKLRDALNLPDNWIKEMTGETMDMNIIKTPDVYSPGLAGMIQRARVDKEVSQNELASRTGLTTSIISDVETASGRPSVNEIIKIMEALEMDIPDIITENLAEYEEITEEEKVSRHNRLCAVFRIERRASRIRLVELADDMKMNKGNLSRIERGQYGFLQAKTMGKLCTALSLEKEWFDITYREHIAKADNGSWVCPICMKQWSRYRIDCECREGNDDSEI